jgi:hypothetical protein
MVNSATAGVDGSEALGNGLGADVGHVLFTRHDA